MKNYDYDAIENAAYTRFRDIITAINKADNGELLSLCISSLFACEDDLLKHEVAEVKVTGNTFTTDGKKYVLAYCRDNDTTTVFRDMEHTYKYVYWFYGSIPDGDTISDNLVNSIKEADSEQI